MRMQPDAATRPQDRVDFGTQLRLESHLDLWCGAADAQALGAHHYTYHIIIPHTLFTFVWRVLGMHFGEEIMGLDMQWEDEWGKPLAAFPDAHDVFASILATRPLDHTICLRFIDEYGDTVFNCLQVPVLVAELQALIDLELAPEANERLTVMITFIQAMPQARDAYLKFYGD